MKSLAHSSLFSLLPSSHSSGRRTHHRRPLHTGIGASVNIGLSIIALHRIDDAITTTLSGAVGATHRIGLVAIALITLVTVLITKPDQAITAAGVGTGAGAGIGVHHVAVFAFFIGIEAAIAAFDQAARVTAVAAIEIAIIAGLSMVDDPVATLKSGEANRVLIAAGQGDGPGPGGPVLHQGRNATQGLCIYGPVHHQVGGQAPGVIGPAGDVQTPAVDASRGVLVAEVAVDGPQNPATGRLTAHEGIKVGDGRRGLGVGGVQIFATGAALPAVVEHKAPAVGGDEQEFELGGIGVGEVDIDGQSRDDAVVVDVENGVGPLVARSGNVRGGIDRAGDSLNRLVSGSRFRHRCRRDHRRPGPDQR